MKTISILLTATLLNFFTPAAQAHELSPGEVYKEFVNSIYYAKSMSDLEKYESKELIATQRKWTPAVQKKSMATMKWTYMTNLRVMRADIKDDKADLAICGTAQAPGTRNQLYNSYGNIKMVHEETGWKVYSFEMGGRWLVRVE